MPKIIQESVRPIEKIDGIRIVQVDGLNRGGAAAGADGGAAAGANLAEQAVSAALAYRVQQPLIDALLHDIGLSAGSLEGLTKSLKSSKAGAVAATPPSLTHDAG
jgi:uncharacterized membrane protein YqiK